MEESLGGPSFAFNHMDQIISNLWLGDYIASQDTDSLLKHNIKYILSVTGGVPMKKVRFSRIPSLHHVLPESGSHSQTDFKFIRHECDLFDTEYSDLLSFLPDAIIFIERAITSGNGILIHCQAGMSGYTLQSFRIVPLRLRLVEIQGVIQVGVQASPLRIS